MDKMDMHTAYMHLVMVEFYYYEHNHRISIRLKAY